ncbi:peptidase U32 family protein [Dongia sp.]|uniref:ubiquinone anaerobic biosynthesis protein UbiU n=1 Tax=Dongia sp. TaxID=1977262 RepID=UPI0035B13CBF
MMPPPLELVCPAGTPAALRAAVAAGADAIYCGFDNATNARNFPGLNFSVDEMRTAIAYAHGQNVKVLIAINTYPQAGQVDLWRQAVDRAAELRADAVIIADIGLLDYAATRHPALRRHLSVQASASNAESINFFARAYDVKRVVLPRVLTIAEIAALNAQIDVETEVFVFGGLCVMAEGRCSLSSYITGQSPNMNGVCSPACAVKFERRGDEMMSRLGDYTIDIFPPDTPAGYPTICKGRFLVRGEPQYLFEEPTSLNAMGILAHLQKAGVRALKIEGRQRGKAYIAEVVGGFRRAVDALGQGQSATAGSLLHLTEGGRTTGGAYHKAWR